MRHNLKYSAMVLLATVTLGSTVMAAETESSEIKSSETESPWLLAPTISSDPKLGSAVGFMGAYLKKFDDESPASMFGVVGSYSDTDSFFYGAFVRSFFDNDKQRITALIMDGKVNNNFEDFLGSGIPVSTTDDIDVAVLRYYRLYKNNWYLGFQMVSTNYSIISDDALRETISRYKTEAYLQNR